MRKTKNAIAVFVTVVLILCNACPFVSCGVMGHLSDTGEGSERESELERVKRILEIELSSLAPMYEDIEPLKYDSCTFDTVKEKVDGGHSVKGEVFFTDRHGAVYSQPYRAEIDKGSWAPKIVKSDIVKLN